MWELTLTRTSVNRLNSSIARKNLRAILEVFTRNEAMGFSVKLGPLGDPTPAVEDGSEAWLYQVRAKVTHAGKTQADLVKERFGGLLEKAAARAKKKNWEIVEGRPSHPPTDQGEAEGARGTLPPFVLPELTDEVRLSHFAEIYERDAHLGILHAAVATSLNSGGKVLSHVLLYGKPGGCKTKLLERVKQWYEADGQERVVFVDGTTMTKAGLEVFLIQLAEMHRLPTVLVVDELEKQPMDNLLSLNNLMGSGVLTRLNARTGNLRIPATFTVVGVCNDERALKEFRNGALWSRFTHKVHCARPSRGVARLILEGIAREMGAGENANAWAEAALAFGWDKLGQRDIREIKGHLDGRETLLTGAWQAMKMAVERSARSEAEADCGEG